MEHINGINPDSGLYHVDHMPMAEDPVRLSARLKQLSGESLSIGEQMVAGRDTTVGEIAGEPLHPDWVYRAVGEDALKAYQEAEAIIGFGDEDEFQEGVNNKGVDWYLGGVATRYGDIIIAAPADTDYFRPASDNGHALAKDPRVRHMKSSGSSNPVPLSQVKIIDTRSPTA